jgi:nucleotide-binding universal stress UspA family protein
MKVLIATDGSEFSTAAIEMYCDLFSGAGDEIKVLAVVEPVTHIVGAPFGVVDDFYNRFIEESRAEAAVHLENARNTIAGRIPNVGEIQTEIEVGTPARSIVEAAAEWGAGLIVMGSHGRGFWQRMYLGSVSNSVTHHAPCSVLIVRK